MKEKVKLALLGFLTFFKIGLFTFGGGYVMVSVIQNEIVNKKKWMTDDDMLRLLAISESTPGPFAINASTYIGCTLLGVAGSFIFTLATVLPSFIIILIISHFYETFLEIEIIANAFRGIQAVVPLLIGLAGWKFLKKLKKNIFTIVLLCISFTTLICFEIIELSISSIYFIIVGAVCGFIYSFIDLRKRSEEKQ